MQTSGNGDRREIMAVLYGAEAARLMLEVLSEGDEIGITGYVSPVALTRSHRREIHFFVNRRPVQDSALVAALVKGYHTLLMVGRYPLAALFLELPPDRVDVNVHPTKAEVRFREPERIFTAVQSAVRRALLAHSPVPGLAPGFPVSPGSQLRWTSEPGWSAPARQGDPAWGMAEDQLSSVGQRPPARDELAGIGSEPAPPIQAGMPAGRIPLLRPVGQVANAYLVAEGPDGLYLIDQHAAHERVLFERLMAQRGDEIHSQALLQPVSVDLPPGKARLLVEQMPLLAGLGFQVETFGPHTFLVRAVPALLVGGDPASSLRVLVEDFEEDESPLQAELEARLIARVCKRAAVKAGQSLSPEEQRALLLDLESCHSPRTCPHGRPTMIHLSVDLLERQFGRKG
jgi:DNA mismatch repair protein MutL